ncbi:IS1182 family transposase [Nonomuraea sp. CA-143628]|uniref:IS1182 family transposase n=1 Tax=Nonomuraea sp. CA-143628 TaxID=3239997 RepID=UPI003D9388EB
MRPRAWHPPVELSAAEQSIIKRIKRAKLFIFLRLYRHELFDAAFQEELAGMYGEVSKGHPPIPPAQLALATILQAYAGVSDDEVIEALVMDRRWQLVLDCLDAERPPFAKGTLNAFRTRLMEANLDRRLIERTIEIAQVSGAFGPRALRGALDSSPLWGAGRVEDTWNLMGHALRKAVGVIARRQGWGLAEGTARIAGQAGAPQLAASSLKAALDADWDDPADRQRALQAVLDCLNAVETFIDSHPEAPVASQARACVQIAEQVREQDVTLAADGAPVLIRGVAKDRRISVEDADMRHGRTSRSVLFDGYKRHVLADLDTHLVHAVGITAANVPEAAVTGDIAADLAAQHATLTELHIDRAYLSSHLVREREADLAIFCKAWRVRAPGDRFAKTAFTIDFSTGELTCPNQVSMPLRPGQTVRFPKNVCAACPLRERCTTSTGGRSVSIHPDEQLLIELRERQQTLEGRAQLRQRVGIEHVLAHIGRWQDRRARYKGTRKNLFDLRRTAVVHNLHVIARQQDGYHLAA